MKRFDYNNNSLIIILCVSIKETPDPVMKRFCCGGLILLVLLKGMSDLRIKRFQPSKFFACGRLISRYYVFN